MAEIERDRVCMNNGALNSHGTLVKEMFQTVAVEMRIILELFSPGKVS